MSDLFGSDTSDVDEKRRQLSSPRSPAAAQNYLAQHSRRNSLTPEPKDDDLFGSDSEGMAESQNALSPPHRRKPNAEAGDALQDLFGNDYSDERMRSGESDNDIEDDDGSARSGDETEGGVSKVQVRVMSARVPALPVPRSADGRYALARTPNILQLNPTPFSADSYEDLIEDEHTIAEKHGYKSAITPELASAVEGILSNTVRWRRSVQSNGVIRRESNARLVRWSDGSFTVVIGGQTPESYSISNEQLAGSGKKEQHIHAAAHHPRELLMQSHARLTEQWLVRPSRQSAQSRAAISLLLGRARAKAAGSSAQVSRVVSSAAGTKGSRMRFMVVDEDPALVTKRAEKEEEERERQRKREQRMRERQEARENRTERDYSGYNSASIYASGDYSEDDHDYGYGSADGEVDEGAADTATAAYGRARVSKRPRERQFAVPQPRQPVRDGYADEEDDGFIVDDDEELEVGPHDEFDEEEEEELAAQRLKSAKQADYMDSEGESDRNTRMRSTKSRRLKDSDDEDEDDF
ncbi:Leo1-like protein-domain-containing protein [Coemansia spiralis]|nr:Leo1-like protein-domain-containing protein [Coemansia spiralis]